MEIAHNSRETLHLTFFCYFICFVDCGSGHPFNTLQLIQT